MKTKTVILLTATVALLMASCIKDEAANTECDIESAWVEGWNLTKHFYDAADMRKDNISTGNTEILFSVRSLSSLPKQIPVYFKITPGARIIPASGSTHNFTRGPVTYTVVSEDGQWKRTYKVGFSDLTQPITKLSFEHVETKANGNSFYHHFYEYDADSIRRDIWDSGNQGVLLMKSSAEPEDMPTYSTPDGYQGKAVCLNTQAIGDLGRWVGKPIAAGNLFWGKFVLENVLTNTLRSTQFGIGFNKKPLRVTGFYKYKPGPVFTNQKMETVPDRTDEASIYAVFYRNKDDKGQPYYLYGDEVETDEQLLANPQVYKIARVATLPPTDEWTPFEMVFQGRDADDAVVAQQGFNLTLVFSSSKYGDKFEGAVGSTLYIDEVEIECEE